MLLLGWLLIIKYEIWIMKKTQTHRSLQRASEHSCLCEHLSLQILLPHYWKTPLLPPPEPKEEHHEYHV